MRYACGVQRGAASPGRLTVEEGAQQRRCCVAVVLFGFVPALDEGRIVLAGGEVGLLQILQDDLDAASGAHRSIEASLDLAAHGLESLESVVHALRLLVVGRVAVVPERELELGNEFLGRHAREAFDDFLGGELSGHGSVGGCVM